jgi:uncharacterized protein (DUF1697 family)
MAGGGMTGQQEEWFADVEKAADDLGYTVETVDYRSPGQIVLRPTRVKGDLVIRIEASFMPRPGALIRSLLRDTSEGDAA